MTFLRRSDCHEASSPEPPYINVRETSSQTIHYVNYRTFFFFKQISVRVRTTVIENNSTFFLIKFMVCIGDYFPITAPPVMIYSILTKVDATLDSFRS